MPGDANGSLHHGAGGGPDATLLHMELSGGEEAVGDRHERIIWAHGTIGQPPSCRAHRSSSLPTLLSTAIHACSFIYHPYVVEFFFHRYCTSIYVEYLHMWMFLFFLIIVYHFELRLLYIRVLSFVDQWYGL